MKTSKIPFLLNICFSLLILASSCKREIKPTEDTTSGIVYHQAGDKIKVRSVEKTLDGGFIYAGIQAEDAFLLKVDANGHKQWYKTFGGRQFDEFHHAIGTKDGGIMAVGFTNSFGTDSALGKVSGYAVRTDANGNVIWSNTYKQGVTELSFRAVAENASGGFAITGVGYASLIELCLVSLDKDGKKLFSKIYTDYNTVPPLYITRRYFAYGLCVEPQDNGKFLVASIMSKSNYLAELGIMMPCLSEMSTTGTMTALYRDDSDVPGSSYYGLCMAEKKRNIGFKFLRVSDGYLFATTFELPGTKTVIQLVKTDASGNLITPIWKKRFAGLGNALFLNINDNGDGTYLLCGTSTTYPMSYTFLEMFNGLQSTIIKVDGNGNEIWTRYYGSKTNTNMAMCARPTADGGYTVAGFTSINTSVFNKMYWMKLDAQGNLLNQN